MAAGDARNVARHGLVGTSRLELVVRRLLGFALAALELALVVLLDRSLGSLDRKLLRLEFEFHLSDGAVGPKLRRRHRTEVLRLDQLGLDICQKCRAVLEIEQDRLHPVLVPPAKHPVFPRGGLAEPLRLLDRPCKDRLFGILVLGLQWHDGGKLDGGVVAERMSSHYEIHFARVYAWRRRHNLKTRVVCIQMASGLTAKIHMLLENETDAKQSVKNLRDELNELFEQTAVYKSVFDAAVETTKAHKVSEKIAKAHALKVARMVYTPKDDGEAAEEA